MRGYNPKYAIGVAAAFIQYRGKFLLTFDPKFRFWRVPGGRMERDEPPERTLQREMREELGIAVRVDRFIGFGRDNVWVKPEKRWRSRVILYFLVRTKAEKIKPLKSEISAIRWLTLKQLKSTRPLEPAMHDLFRRFPSMI